VTHHAEPIGSVARSAKALWALWPTTPTPSQITAKSNPPATAPQAGLIDTEPTSELVVIAYGELAELRTVIVDVPTNVRVLIL
jgi:hypothetical protein